MSLYLGIDLGGTNIDAGVVDSDYTVRARTRRKTRLPRPAAAIVADMAEAAQDAMRRAGARREEIAAVGIGSPGNVNMESGVVEFAGNFGFHNVPLRDMLHDSLGLPVFIANDANAAAYGEFLAGAGSGTRDYIAITLGTGVGSGIIIDRRLYCGHNGAAGELGHTVIAPDGPVCTCGRRGCVEMLVSATALIRDTRAAMAANPDSAMHRLAASPQLVTGRTAFDAARSGDASAAVVVTRYLEYLSIVVANLVNMFQPERLSIGGGIAAQGDNLLRPLTLALLRDRFSRNSTLNTELVVSKLGNDAGIIGAAMLYVMHGE